MGGSTLIIVYIAIFVGIIYLFAVMPQRRLRRAQAQLMTKLHVGVEIITTGGLYGTVTEIEDGDTLLIEVAEDTEVRIAKAAISRILDDASVALSWKNRSRPSVRGPALPSASGNSACSTPST